MTAPWPAIVPSQADTPTYYLERLRVVLTLLVIAHHTAITYGASGGWFYREVPEGSGVTGIVLSLFCAVNQSFFMGLFFLLAGYFTPQSVLRKGRSRYLVDRAARLGIPWLAFGFVLGPMTAALAATAQGKPFLAVWQGLMTQARFIQGPMWFVAALMLFAIAYLAWVSIGSTRAAGHDQRSLSGHRTWLLAALAVGMAAFVIRLWIPVGKEVIGLQLGYFASYGLLFVLGCVASRHQWLQRVGQDQARFWLRVSFVAFPFLPLTGLAYCALQGQAVDFDGGLNLPSAVYAFWEPFVAWGIMAALLWSFRLRWNTADFRWQRLGACAYGAFIVHAPVIVALAIAAQPLGLPPALKFIAVSLSGAVISFAVSACLRSFAWLQAGRLAVKRQEVVS